MPQEAPKPGEEAPPAERPPKEEAKVPEEAPKPAEAAPSAEIPLKEEAREEAKVPEEAPHPAEAAPAEKPLQESKLGEIVPKEELKEEAISPKEEAIPPKEEAIQSKEEAVSPKEEAIPSKEEAIPPKEEAKEEAIQSKEEAVSPKEEAIPSKEEAVSPKEGGKEEAIQSKEEAVSPKEEAISPKEKARPSEKPEFFDLAALRIQFGFDDYSLTSQARENLEKIASWMSDNSAAKIQIQGNTCNIGTAEYNLALGENRAISAKKYLQSLGVSPSRLSTISYGMERPMLPNTDEANRSKNRRDEFVKIK
jgi:peptidoglycan-associated lipoprotein